MVDREKVDAAVEQLRPIFLEHEGSIDVVDVTDDGVVKVSLSGQCELCMYREKTVRALEKIMASTNAGVRSVEAV